MVNPYSSAWLASCQLPSCSHVLFQLKCRKSTSAHMPNQWPSITLSPPTEGPNWLLWGPRRVQLDWCAEHRLLDVANTHPQWPSNSFPMLLWAIHIRRSDQQVSQREKICADGLIHLGFLGFDFLVSFSQTCKPRTLAQSLTRTGSLETKPYPKKCCYMHDAGTRLSIIKMSSTYADVAL